MASRSKKTSEKQTKLTEIFKRQNDKTSLPKSSISTAERTSGENTTVDVPVSNQIRMHSQCQGASSMSTGNL